MWRLCLAAAGGILMCSCADTPRCIDNIRTCPIKHTLECCFDAEPPHGNDSCYFETPDGTTFECGGACATGPVFDEMTDYCDSLPVKGGGDDDDNGADCPNTAACGCSNLNKDECPSDPCCAWYVGEGCNCR